MKKTKIVCTIGPASESIEKLTALAEAGMNVSRLNFSHGDHEEHLARINNIKKVRQETGDCWVQSEASWRRAIQAD